MSNQTKVLVWHVVSEYVFYRILRGNLASVPIQMNRRDVREIRDIPADALSVEIHDVVVADVSVGDSLTTDRLVNVYNRVSFRIARDEEARGLIAQGFRPARVALDVANNRVCLMSEPAHAPAAA